MAAVFQRPRALVLATQHVRFHNTSGVGPHGARVARKVHHADIAHPRFLVEPRKAAILGAPMTWGQPKAGTDTGPDMLRQAGLSTELGNLGWEVEDMGDITFVPPSASDPQGEAKYVNQMKNCYAVGKGCQQVFERVSKQAAAGKFVLTVGGDHSIGAGTVAGILQARPNTGVIWVDAHADINTPDVSESGNIHGMPVAFLMRLIDPRKYPGWEWMASTPVLRPQQLVYIGLRDVDAAERVILKDMGITCFTMQHVDKYGIGRVMEMTLDHLAGRPLHCSYDIDGVDPAFAPSTGTAVRGGLTFREAHYVVEAVSESGHLGSLDMVEVNPGLGTFEESKETIEMGLALVASAMGSRIV